MLSPQAIADRIGEQFASSVITRFVDAGEKHPRVHIDASTWRDLAQFLKADPALSFDWLACLGGVDYPADGKLAIVIDLWSFTHRHTFAIKVFCDRTAPVIPSVTDIWKAAGWHEREAYDLFGIQFTGHPDLRRLLLADDWEGHPLRKDYVFPAEVNGIPATAQLEWQARRPTA